MSQIVVSAGKLPGEQVKALKEFLADRFTLMDLRMLAREEFDQHLDALVNEDVSLTYLAFDLIDRLEREGRIGELVEAITKRNPKYEEALEAIFAGRPPVPLAPSQDLHEFREKLRERRKWWTHLNAYKGLHELLHELGGILPQISEEALARAKNARPLPKTTIDTLQFWAQEAKRLAADTEFSRAPPMSVWIPRFELAVKEFVAQDSARHDRALERIASLPGQQLSYLNGELVACARRIEALKLVELLDKTPITTQNMTVAIVAFRDPCVRLEALIGAHDLCQQIDTELREAAKLTVISLDKLEWSDVQGWLDTLVEKRAVDQRVIRTKQAARKFQEAPTSDTFHTLVEKFDDLFKNIDSSLRDVTNILVGKASELVDVLEGLQ